MINRRAILILPLLLLALTCRGADDTGAWEILGGVVEFDPTSGAITYSASNGVTVRYGGAVLQAERVSVNRESGVVQAEGNVRIYREDHVWVGDVITYNFKTRQIQSEQFRMGKSPVLIAGQGLHGDMTNRVYSGTNALATTDDVSHPFQTVRAKSIKIVPGKYIEARHATVLLGGVPVFYFPYYKRRLEERVNQFSFIPGYRSEYGAFLYSSYTWFLDDHLDGRLRLDYRSKRGVGTGADVNYDYGRWGEGAFRYYYLYDQNPETNSAGQPYPNNRQIVQFSYQADPWTNVNLKSVVRYQSDADVLREFFERIYRENPQPDTYFTATKFWENFSLEAYAQPRINDFFETVERLPQVQFTGHRQQLGRTPLFYESVSSVGYYDRLFAQTNNSLLPPPDFAATRADTFHQLFLPYTFFGWLNVTPRAGGRYTYYSEATGPGATTSEANRWVFNTGAEVSFRAMRTWGDAQSKLLEVDGVRHVFQPSLNYVYVPTPNYAPSQLPQFDYLLPSLQLLPVDFPQYNAIDAIYGQNLFRLGMRNLLQTRRTDGVGDFVAWDLFTDWQLEPLPGQSTFSDIYSDLTFKPRSWFTFESQNRWDVNTGEFNLARETFTFTPNNTWSWGITYYYLNENNSPYPPYNWGIGNNIINSTMYYRLNENWGFRMLHYFNAASGVLQEQDYVIYRDLRSWTAALVLRWQRDVDGDSDFTVAFTFSLKARPRYKLGADSVRPFALLGS